MNPAPLRLLGALASSVSSWLFAPIASQQQLDTLNYHFYRLTPKDSYNILSPWLLSVG